jgi:hypothetical protein
MVDIEENALVTIHLNLINPLVQISWLNWVFFDDLLVKR